MEAAVKEMALALALGGAVMAGWSLAAAVCGEEDEM
jgi:hypothetical protein